MEVRNKKTKGSSRQSVKKNRRFFKAFGVIAERCRDLSLAIEKLRDTEPLNTQPIVICLVASIVLATIHFYALINYPLNFLLSGLISDIWINFGGGMLDTSFIGIVSWALLVILFLFIIPSFIIKTIFKESLKSYGISFKNITKDKYLYLALFILMVPLVIYASTFPQMREIFPFYKITSKNQLFPKFVIWEILYCIQFFAVEFFFRGFLLHGLKRYLGYNVIFIAALPYSMIHYNKTFAETIGSIFAGIVLGHLSLKRNSVIFGWVLHCLVALTMDMSVLIATI